MTMPLLLMMMMKYTYIVRWKLDSYKFNNYIHFENNAFNEELVGVFPQCLVMKRHLKVYKKKW